MTKEEMSMQQIKNDDSTAAAPPSYLPDPMEPIRKMVQTCIQCGTCSGSCPNEFAMDVTPRKMWRMVMTGKKEALFQSKTFSLCSACYCCTLRCPRGLPLTDAMAALKQIASSEKLKKYRQSTLFYKNFTESVRRHGRVREMEFMTLYFIEMKNPFLPLKFTSLGLRLMQKRKIGLQFPSRGKGRLENIFRKVEELENVTDHGRKMTSVP
jgi:heterodisulfide reductase subunit C2